MASPGKSIAELTKTRVSSWLNALNRTDARAMARLFKGDATTAFVGVEGDWHEVKGSAAIAGQFDKFLPQLKKSTHVLTRVIQSSNVVILLGNIIEDGSGLPWASVMWTNINGLILKEHTYIDRDTLHAPVAIIPPSEKSGPEWVFAARSTAEQDLANQIREFGPCWHPLKAPREYEQAMDANLVCDGGVGKTTCLGKWAKTRWPIFDTMQVTIDNVWTANSTGVLEFTLTERYRPNENEPPVTLRALEITDVKAGRVTRVATYYNVDGLRRAVKLENKLASLQPEDDRLGRAGYATTVTSM
jgi:hypothetical protein